MKMDKDIFWQIIDSVNSEVSGFDLEGVLRVTQEKLQEYNPREIAVWANFLRHYRELADTSGVFAASCALNEYMTDDGFLDFRAWLISRGKEVYLAALKDPDSLAELEIPKCTRFELYGYVAYDAYREICEDDVYAEMDANPLTKAQKEDIRAEIEYYSHQITMENAESHLPNLYAKYLRPGQSILLVDYQPGFPRLPNESKNTTELEKLKSAATLIDTMTQGRQTFKSGIGGAYISAAETTCFKLMMDVATDGRPEHCHVTFSAQPKTTGIGMDCDALRDMLTEANQLYALLLALEMQDYQPSITEFLQFSEAIEKEQQNGPIMGQTF